MHAGASPKEPLVLQSYPSSRTAVALSPRGPVAPVTPLSAQSAHPRPPVQSGPVASTARLPEIVARRLRTIENLPGTMGTVVALPGPPAAALTTVVPDSFLWGCAGAVEDEPDLDAVKQTTKKAFRGLAARYRATLEARDREIELLKAQCARHAVGGEAYVEQQLRGEAANAEIRRLETKVKSLVKLLDRAGAAMRMGEEKRGPQSGGGLADGYRTRVDWEPLRGVMRDLYVQDRSDQQVLMNVARYIQSLTSHVAELEAAAETTSHRIAEADNAKETLFKAVQAHKKEVEDLKEELQKQNRTTYGGDISEMATMRQEFEAERAKLLHQIQTLETAMRNTVDSRPFFVALGKAISVPPFLRYDGRIKNISLPKTTVENIINALWLTRFLPNLTKCKSLEDAGITADVRKRGPKALLEAFDEVQTFGDDLERMFAAEGLINPSERAPNNGSRRSSMFGSESRRTSGMGTSLRAGGFVDYDNLAAWTVRRTDIKKLLSFQDHVARFLLELCKPEKVPIVFAQYSVTEGVGTPPVVDVARQARAVLLLCAPQGSTIMRPAATMPTEVVEISYSLIDGCDRFSFDADIELFRRIVKAQLPEAAFYDQMIMLQKLKITLLHSAAAEREELRSAAGFSERRGSQPFDPDEESEVRAPPTVGSVLRTLRRFFPAKSPDEHRLLQRALLLDVNAISLTGEDAAGGQRGQLAGMGSVPESQLCLEVDVRALFASNDSGNQGYFLETVRNQHLESLSTYMSEVQCAIMSLATAGQGGRAQPAPSPRNPRGSFMVSRQHENTATVLAIREKLQGIDPTKPRSDINQYVFHLLQLHFGERARLHMPDADLIHRPQEDWFEPPLCNQPVNVIEMAKMCPVVIAKRCGPAPVTASASSPHK